MASSSTQHGLASSAPPEKAVWPGQRVAQRAVAIPQVGEPWRRRRALHVCRCDAVPARAEPACPRMTGRPHHTKRSMACGGEGTGAAASLLASRQAEESTRGTLVGSGRLTRAGGGGGAHLEVEVVRVQLAAVKVAHVE